VGAQPGDECDRSGAGDGRERGGQRRGRGGLS